MIIITKHASQRLQERFPDILPENYDEMISDAYNNGLNLAQIYDKDEALYRKLIKTIHKTQKVKYHNNIIFIFADNRLVTLYPYVDERKNVRKKVIETSKTTPVAETKSTKIVPRHQVAKPTVNKERVTGLKDVETQALFEQLIDAILS